MKKLFVMIFVLLTALALAVSVFAAGSCSGKVTKNDGEKVTVTLAGAVPAWAKKGATVRSMGYVAKVISVNGKDVALKFNKGKTANFRIDSIVTVTTPDGEMQGC